MNTGKEAIKDLKTAENQARNKNLKKAYFMTGSGVIFTKQFGEKGLTIVKLNEEGKSKKQAKREARLKK